ncbi:MAG: DUF2845 domain-containing protein [Myxococcota bacterium]
MIRILLASAAFLFVLAGASSSASAMSCQRQIVSRGDYQVRVQRLCGEPAQRIQSTVERARQVLVRTAGGALVANEVRVSVLVERWVYDFGPRRLMRELTFEDGVLVNIRTVGRGLRARKAEADAPKAVAPRWALPRR